MNIAFQAFVLLLLYFPGALLLAGFLGKISQEEEMPGLTSSLTSRTAIALILSLILHAAWIGGGELIYRSFDTPWRPNPYLILDLLISNGKENPNDETDATSADAKSQGDSIPYKERKLIIRPEETAIRQLSNNLGPMFSYFISIYVCGWAIGAGIHRAIRMSRLDQKYRFLRFPNHWHYSLSGERANFGTFNKVVPFVAIQALVEIEGKAYVYSGRVVRWHHSPIDGSLEWILIVDPSRTVISDGIQNPIGEALPVGTLFLKFEEVKNFLLRYYTTDEKADGEL